MKVKVGIFTQTPTLSVYDICLSSPEMALEGNKYSTPDIANISVSMGVAISIHSIVILKILKKTYKIVLEFLRLIKWKSKFYLFFLWDNVSNLYIDTLFQNSLIIFRKEPAQVLVHVLKQSVLLLSHNNVSLLCFHCPLSPKYLGKDHLTQLNKLSVRFGGIWNLNKD